MAFTGYNIARDQRSRLAEQEMLMSKNEKPINRSIEITEFEYTLQYLGRDYNGFNLVYAQGSTATLRSAVRLKPSYRASAYSPLCQARYVR